MRHRVSALLAASVLAATGLAAASPERASASEYCDYEDSTPPTVMGYSPRTVTVGTHSTLVRFSVQASDDCGIDDWEVFSDDAGVFAYKKSPTEAVYGWQNSDAGASYVDVRAYDPAYNVTTKRFSFRLLRATRWTTVNASPEPVRKGGTVTVTGTLQRADWDDNVYRGYSGQRVSVQFKAKNSSTWKSVKTVTAGKSGKVSAKVKASGTTGRDGSYRLSFGGNGTSGSSSSGSDFVDVR